MNGLFCFEKLKEICIEVVKQPSSQSLESLFNYLTEIKSKLGSEDSSNLQGIREYASFPLKMILTQKNKISEDTLLHCLKCLKLLASFSPITSWEYFANMFCQLFVLLTGTSPDQKIDAKQSEEIKTAVVKCSKALVENLSLRLTLNFYGREFCPALAHAVFVLLWLAQNERQRELRILAMETLVGFFSFESDAELRIQMMLGDRLAAFLPGITIAMAQIALGDTKQGSRVTTMALNVWAFTVVLCIGDDNLNIRRKQNSLQTPAVELISEIPEIDRSKSWLENTAPKLAILIQRLSALVSHERITVRLALLDWAEQLLLNCFCSLKGQLAPALDVIVTLMNDHFPNIASKSHQAISKISDCLSQSNSTDLLSQLEENLFSMSTKLPRILRTADEIEKQNALNLLSGHLELLGPKIDVLLNSVPHLERLLLALLQVSEMDTTHNIVLEDHPKLQTLGEVLTTRTKPIWPAKSFKHFRSDKIYDCLKRTCRLLGQYGDLSLLMDFFLNQSGPSLLRKESILVLNLVLEGLPFRKSQGEDLSQIINYVLEEFLSPSLWNIKVEEMDSTSYDTNLMIIRKERSGLSQKIRSNVVQKCLLIEGISGLSNIAKEGFRSSLLLSLCPLLEEIGSQSSPISYAASSALAEISLNCKYNSVSDLIFENSDYLAHCLSVRLSHYEDFPSTPLILEAIFRLSRANILPLTQDLLIQVLDLMDQYHSKRSLLLLKVLGSFLKAVINWEKVHVEDTEENAKFKPQSCEQNLASFLLEYKHTKELAETFEESMEEEPDIPMEEEMKEINEEKTLTPLHVDIVIKILERCIHTQSSPDPWVRLSSLDCVLSGILILKNEGNLLEMVHRLWSPLVSRFQDSELVVISKAFDVLLLLSRVSGNFIAKRCEFEVWPKILSFLENQLKISAGKDSGSTYRFTLKYKLQLKMLTHFGELIQNLEVEEKLLETVCHHCLDYMVQKQPLELAQSAQKSLQAMVKIDPDLVWLCVYSRGEGGLLPKTPSIRFPSISFPNEKSSKFNFNELFA